MIKTLEKLKGLFRLKCTKKEEPKPPQEGPESQQERSEVEQKPEEQE